MVTSRRKSARGNRGRIASQGHSGSLVAPPPPTPPAQPTLTAPTNGATITNGTPLTVSATTPDTNLSSMSWVLDGVTVVASVAGTGTPPGTFSTSWTPAGVTAGAHTLVARATRGASSADSTSISVTASGGAPVNWTNESAVVWVNESAANWTDS